MLDGKKRKRVVGFQCASTELWQTRNRARHFSKEVSPDAVGAHRQKYLSARPVVAPNVAKSVSHFVPAWHASVPAEGGTFLERNQDPVRDTMAASEDQAQKTQQDPFVLRVIFQYLPAKDLARVRLVSQLWNTVVIWHIQNLLAGQRTLANPFASLLMNRSESKDFLWERLSAHLSNWNLRLTRESLDEDVILRRVHDGSFSAWNAPFLQLGGGTPPENEFFNVSVNTVSKV